MARYVSIGLGAIISIIGVVMMFRVFENNFIAASDKSPREVNISEIGANQAKITWTSDASYIGSLDLGTAIDRLDSHYQEISTEKRTKHEVLVTLLAADTTYYFQVEDDTGVIYKNASAPGQAGLPWSFTTKSKEQQNSGTVVNPIPSRGVTLPMLKVSPTPIQSLIIPDNSSSSIQIPSDSDSCSQSDCAAIHSRLGRGCTITDYQKCLLKQ